MLAIEQNILKYCYWLDDETLTILKKQMATVEKARLLSRPGWKLLI
jgi:hypothetical protein